MHNLILKGRVLLPLLLPNVLLLNNIFAVHQLSGRYSIHSNSSLNSTSILDIKVFQVTECLLKCLTTPRCLSLNVMKESMATDGTVTCHLFNVTHNSLALNLDFNPSTDYYKNVNFEDCYEAKCGRSTTGVHSLRPRNGLQFNAYCDMEKDGGGWTVIQKRFNGLVDFARPWVDYKKGFGDVNGEHWLGLDAMHELTKDGISNLRVDMWDNGEYYFAVYSNVEISDEAQDYQLDYEKFIEGTDMSSDSLEMANGMKFSTLDKDNDKAKHGSCSNGKSNAGWWFRKCTDVNPNGNYTPGDTSLSNGIYWKSFRGKGYSIQRIEMKIRRIL